MADHAESSRGAFCSDFLYCAVKERTAMLSYCKNHKVKGFSEQLAQSGILWETIKAASAVLGKVCGRNLRK